MKRRLLSLSLGLGAMLLATQHAFSQTQSCAARQQVVDQLLQSYGETRQSIGLGSNNSVVEVFASQETGTWTIIVTLPDGQTCLVATGQEFEILSEVLPAPGSADA